MTNKIKKDQKILLNIIVNPQSSRYHLGHSSNNIGIDIKLFLMIDGSSDKDKASQVSVQRDGEKFTI